MLKWMIVGKVVLRNVTAMARMMLGPDAEMDDCR
jgi:hypothetical protein